MDWQRAADIAQIIATAVTGVGVIVSIWFAIRTLREVQADRVHRVRPKLLFDRGGQRVQCELKELTGIPGINPKVASAFLKQMPPGAKGWFPTKPWGRLSNHGNGAAVNAEIMVLAVKVHKAGEVFAVDKKKLLEFPYAPKLNRIPCSPSHVDPGKSCEFYRIPTPILADFTGQLSALECVVVIQCEDIYLNKYVAYQELRVWLTPKGETADLVLTLGEELLALDDDLRGVAQAEYPALGS